VRAVWLCVRAGLRQDWRGLALLTLITAVMGAVVLAALAGARRTDTAVAQFLQYAGPTQGYVSADLATMDKIAALPGVAYAEVGDRLLAGPVSADGRPASPDQVSTLALLDRPPQMRGIILAGRWASQSRADEAVLDESAAQELDAHVGSVLELRGYRPSQMQQVLNGSTVPPQVVLGGVRVTGIIRIPTDLTENFTADADVIYAGQGDVFTTAAFYQKYGASVANFLGLSFQLKQGAADLPAFEAQVKRIAGGNAQVELGADDNATAGAFAQRGTTLEALALLVFAIIVALALLVVVGQSLARQAYAAVGDFPALRSLGATPRQLTAVTLAPGALVAVAGMALAIPLAYLLSWFTPIGLARRAEISPGFAFDAAAMLGGAAVLALLLAGRAALAAPRAARTGVRTVAERPGARVAGRLAARGLSPAAVSGIQLAFDPGRGRSAVPVRAAIVGMAAALAAVLAALVFGSSVSRVIGDPALAGWDWDVTVGNPHSGDVSAQAVPRLRADTFVSGFTVTAMGGTQLDGRDDVTIVGLQTVTGRVVPPVLAGRLPDAPGEIALGGRELRALGKSVGDTVRASGPHGPVPLRVTGEVVLSPEITNEQTELGTGAVMTMAGALAVSQLPMPRNVFLVSLRNPASPAAIAALRQQFPGTVLPAVPPPEVRDLSGVSGLPLILAFVLMLLACGIIAHTLLTSVRRRRRDLAILKTVGFVTNQVRATVAWQATALACAGLIVGVPLGLLAGRWAWILFAGQEAIVPAPVISPLTLLAIPAVLLLANAIAAVPARNAARTQPAVILRAE
jgi:FtsX-like permease family